MRNKYPPSKVYTLAVAVVQYLSTTMNTLCCALQAFCTALPAMEVQPPERRPTLQSLEQRLSHAEAHCGDWIKEERLLRKPLVCREKKEAMSRILGEPSKALFRYRNELEEMKHAYRKENEEYPSEKT